MTNEHLKLIADMLASVDNAFNHDTTAGKAAVMRAALGSVDPADDMLAICECGWRGTINDASRVAYDSGGDSWRRHAGRSGWHWNCPRCDRTIWSYYTVIN